MAQKPRENKSAVYNSWHAELYQTDIGANRARFAMLHNRIINDLHVTNSSTGRLLDVACGKGVFLLDVAEGSRIRCYGSDISRVAISKAKKLASGTEFTVADAEHLPYADNFFDYVTCIGGLEYFTDPVAGAEEITRVLKKGGKCVLYVPNLMFIGYIWLALRSGIMPTHGGSSSHKTYYDYRDERFYTLKGWEDIITRGGLKIIKTERYDRLGSTKYAHPVLLKLYENFLSALVPKTLAYCYLFTCTK